MSKQTFPAGSEPRVIITQVSGDIRVRVGDEQVITFSTDATPRELYEEGGTLTLTGCDDDLDLRLPASTILHLENIRGDVNVAGVRQVELISITGDVDLAQISEAITLAELAADLDVTHAPALLARGDIGGDATLKDVGRVEIESISADLSAKRAETVVVGTVNGDLEIEDITGALRCGNIDGDCDVQGSSQVEVTVNTVNGSLEVTNAAHVHVSSVTGDCDLAHIQGDVQVVTIGDDASFTAIGGQLQVGEISGDVTLRNVHRNVTISSVGGDLVLQSDFPPDTITRIQVGNDADIMLPNNPNLILQANVNGEVRGSSVAASSGGNQINLTYGEGTARLELIVEGDLLLRSVNGPRHSSVSSSWEEFGRDIEDVGREMGKLGQELGREMSKLGQDLSREFKTLFGIPEPRDKPYRSYGVRRSARAVHKAERRARRMRAKAEKHTRRSRHFSEQQGREPRMRVRFNDREWVLDPDRLERIKEQAQRAASEGLSDALEAVERAISKLHVPSPPPPPAAEPAPEATAPTLPPEPQPATGPTIHLHDTAESESDHSEDHLHASTDQPEGPHKKSPLEPQQERMAILHMVAEGRITPEEGDLLLEALDS